MSKFSISHDTKYRFDISRVTNGNFKNLWRLQVQTPNDNSLVELIDADSLSTVLDRIQYVFEADGL